MDNDKLDKAALSASASYNGFPNEPYYDQNFYDGFKQGVKWLLQQPLVERLSELEMVNIRKKYLELKELNSLSNDMFSDDTAMFEWLFGKDFFKEEER